MVLACLGVFSVAAATPVLPKGVDASVNARTTNATNTFATDSLDPIPNPPTVTTDCDSGSSSSADLSWTITPLTSFATGYKVERWLGNPPTSLQSTVNLTRTTVNHHQSGLAPSTNYTWIVYASYASWTARGGGGSVPTAPNLAIMSVTAKTKHMFLLFCVA